MDKFIKSLSVLIFQICLLTQTSDAYKIGVGRADCTGPPVEVVFVSIIYT